VSREPARGRGTLIAFCGGEGAGKSTQIRLLAEHLATRGIAPVVTREPGGTEAGAALRKLLLTEATEPWDPLAETLLMIADRVQHIARVIMPALAAGRTVITDRFVLSTLAYQGGGRGVPRDLIRDWHREACADLWPDLTILLDLAPELGLARSKRRLSQSGSDETRFEALDLAFHQRVRATFLDEARLGRNRCLVIDATRSVDDVQASVRSEVDALLSGDRG
jgi:dTMP kinase